ncbi:hypothetical protein, partial [Streptococcus pneumoniae]|uniref:hypothetical protein n=1 Tax=Streptococcus pneumoniae TaxID=1313 RepID=UPI0018B0837E
TWNGKQDALGFTAENVSNKAVDLDVINDTLYPTVALLDSLVNAKQNTLVSGTNIKTINSTSLLGSGDIVISGGSGNVGEATLSFGST